MGMTGLFIVNSITLGACLSVDALSVSVVNGFSEPGLHIKKAFKIASVFAFFQALMPMAGWFLTNFMMQHFRILEGIIPYLALGLLVFLGLKMIFGSMYHQGDEAEARPSSGGGELFTQGIATSLDALSVGLAITEYSFTSAFVCSLIIALVTFIICSLGVLAGKRIGEKIAGKAELAGGMVLIVIGAEIFLRGI